MHLFYLSGLYLRFYIDGLEEDVQDPSFFMDEDKCVDIVLTLEEMLNDYGKSLRMAEQRKESLLQDNCREFWREGEYYLLCMGWQ